MKNLPSSVKFLLGCFKRRPNLAKLDLAGDDGASSLRLTGIKCGECKNVFWIPYADIEHPCCCPFCAVRFDASEEISGADFNSGLGA